ncbi:A1 cistron-splicing factor [Aspergillus egyptiacus]|nr:A1 cistron-splicing factor [Aspergillus egyptiacus]
MASITPTPTLLLPALPPKTLIGIDLITFTSTPNFHGIRDIPAGWHFLYSGTTEGFSLRSGAWFYVHDSDGAKNASGAEMQILVWKWNPETEGLEPLRSEQREEGMRLRANIGALWRGGVLFGYRSRVPRGVVKVGQQGGGTVTEDEKDEEEEEGRREWRGLTDKFSARLLSRIIGEPGGRDIDWEGRPRWLVTSGSTARRDDDDIPGLGGGSFAKQGTEGEEVNEVAVAPTVMTVGEREPEFSFLPVDLKMTWREGAIGRERTEAARDRSWALGDIISRVSGGGGDAEGQAQVLGELQFTFLMGLTLMNYSCLQQWKRLLGLILTCRRAVVERASFMADVLCLLLRQLKRCGDVEGGLFDQLGGEGGGDGGDFLRKLLRGFRTVLYEEVDAVSTSPVKAEFERLEAWVKDEFDWELNRDAVLRKGMIQLEDGEEVEVEMINEEEDDYAPVIVDLDETDFDDRAPNI